MNQIEKLLDRLLSITKSGLNWEKYDSDAYRAQTKAGEVRIMFLFPMLADETTSGADIAKLSINSVDVNFFEGSNGMNKIREILYYGNNEWKEHQEMHKAKINEVLKNLL